MHTCIIVLIMEHNNGWLDRIGLYKWFLTVAVKEIVPGKGKGTACSQCLLHVQ